MLSKLKQRKQEGFTIIEVLIVLAIAGLILLVVFLAVPALQRNARNTQRTNDVAGILGAVNNFINNNNGILPNTLSVDSTGTLTVSNTSVTGSSEVTADLGYYTAGVSWEGTAPTSSANTTTTETVEVYGQGECNEPGTEVTQAPSPRAVAATFTLEEDAPRCQES